jgi:hypothetical protein
VESFQTPNGPRQRIILHLGTLENPKNQWRALAVSLETRLAVQSSLLDENCTELVAIANQTLKEDCNDQIKITISCVARNWGKVLGKFS